MYEYQIINVNTNETTVIFGYTYADACRRWKIDSKDYKVMSTEYID